MKNIDLWSLMTPEKLFTAYASELGHGIFEKLPNGKMGVRVFNNKTNNDVAFELLEEHTHRVAGAHEFETLCWDFAPTMEDIARFPRLSGYTLRIFND
jgi:hypothetical protein